jgi:hypothetical protein
LKNAVYLSWVDYDPVRDSGDIYLECPTCELIEEFTTMTAAKAFERAHLNSADHIKKFYFGENNGHTPRPTLPQRSTH